MRVCSSLFRRLARGKPAAVGQALECREPSVSTKSEGSTPSDEALPNGSDGISPCNRRSACVGEKYQQVSLLWLSLLPYLLHIACAKPDRVAEIYFRFGVQSATSLSK